MTIINTEKIQRLIDDKTISAYAIEATTGISRTTITNYRNDKAELMNMSLGNAEKLQKFIDKQKEQETE